MSYRKIQLAVLLAACSFNAAAQATELSREKGAVDGHSPHNNLTFSFKLHDQHS